MTLSHVTAPTRKYASKLSAYFAASDIWIKR